MFQNPFIDTYKQDLGMFLQQLRKRLKEEKIIELLKEAGLYDWYIELPEGLETLAGERGVKLSEGQKQRLNLIRGMLLKITIKKIMQQTL